MGCRFFCFFVKNFFAFSFPFLTFVGNFRMLYMHLMQGKDIDANVAGIDRFYSCNSLSINQIPPPCTILIFGRLPFVAYTAAVFLYLLRNLFVALRLVFVNFISIILNFFHNEKKYILIVCNRFRSGNDGN